MSATSFQFGGYKISRSVGKRIVISTARVNLDLAENNLQFHSCFQANFKNLKDRCCRLVFHISSVNSWSELSYDFLKLRFLPFSLLVICYFSITALTVSYSSKAEYKKKTCQNYQKASFLLTIIE